MAETVRQLADELHALARTLNRRAQLMEVCGTHTVSIFRNGLRSLLPENVNLISGPGCPVCVTAQRHIDAAIRLAGRKDVILATYGDMMRVPGALGSLEQQRARGADVRVVYSARGAIELAETHPNHAIVFIAVGFETTAPATAAMLLEAQQRDVKNLYIVEAHKLVIPAMLALLAGGDVPIDGFLCPGHVSIIIGANAYEPIVTQHRKPCVVAGFEPPNIMQGLVHLLRQIVAGEAKSENVYGVAVSAEGNRVAQATIDRVFVPADAAWRAIGVIPGSGLALRPAFERFDALRHFEIELGEDQDPPGCRCGEVIQGKVTPAACALFATRCTPTDPVGPCMVSSEGTCAAWYKYRPADARAAASKEGNAT